MKKCTRGFALLLSVCILCCTLPTAAMAADTAAAADRTYRYIVSTVPAPAYGSVGDWSVMVVARAGADAPADYLSGYYTRISAQVKTVSGILSSNKYTEYSRTVLALTSAGYDAAHISGYDLTAPLSDVEKVTKQGVNGAAYALLALSSGSYGDAALIRRYTDCILASQLADGGFAISGTTADPDVTSIVLQALSFVRDLPGVEDCIAAALNRLSAMQLENGGFKSYGVESCESTAQVIIALCQLGIPVEDTRFIRDGSTLTDALLSYQLADGSFTHTPGGTQNLVATLQAALALTALQRAAQGHTPLYTMSDAGLCFSDLSGHPDSAAIYRLAACGIVSGMGDGTFLPDKTMTRAEFCAIVVRALNLELETADTFRDVPADRWYAAYIGAACRRGIILGRTSDTFDPEGLISDVEAEIIVSRAAVLLGTLEQSTEEWHYSAQMIRRCEMCTMIYDMLTDAHKL